jgi:chromosome partitioning protein
MPIVVAILNTKGGSGKTTVATHLASMLHQYDGPVLLVDHDPQGSSSDWGDRRVGDDLMPVIRMGLSIARDLPKVSRDYKWVIIDGAPVVNELSAAAVRAADVVLITVMPSPYDVWATAGVVEMVKVRQQITDGQPKAAFLISRAIKNTNLSKDVRDALAEYELPVFKANTFQFKDYPELAAVGKSVLALGEDEKPRFDIKKIMMELQELANE